jgi:hypothetical protein
MTTTPATSAPHPVPTVPPTVAALQRLGTGERADAPAVVGVDGSHTFRALRATADRVARDVRAKHSGPHANLGVVGRSTGGFVAALLGCVQAGIPCSVIAPESRVDPRFLGLSATLDVDTVDDPSEDVLPADPAPVAAGEDWAVGRFGLTGDDRIALWSGIPGQVVSTICSAVCAGAMLDLTPPVLADAAAMAERLRDGHVTVLVTTTPVLRTAVAMAADAAWSSLRLVLVDHGGELFTADVTALRRVAPAASVASTYRTDRLGVPLAVHVYDGLVPADEPDLVPAGIPPTGSALTVINAAGRPAGFGEIGEVCSDTTPTGDLARRWPDGTLELVGAAGESRDLDRVATLAALRELPGVYDMALVDDLADDGSTLRIGYVAAADAAALDQEGTRRRLSATLPERQIPRHVVALAVLPLTSAGVHDLDALPEVDHDGTVVDQYVAPRTPLEQELCTVLQKLLAVERVGINDSFFQLGGFSLLATQLTTRIRESYGVSLMLRDIFDAPTVDGLAHLIVLRQIETAGDDIEALLAEIEHAATDLE